jgi:hypothetical protein
MLLSHEEVAMNEPSAGRWMAILFGIVPLGIGLTVLGFLWFTPFGEFHSPPLFFRVFGTFVAIPFVFIGGAAILGGLGLIAGTTHSRAEAMAKDLKRELSEGAGTVAPSARSTGYVCPSCSAPLGEKADVSPSGDVKCAHCGRWFNIHT